MELESVEFSFLSIFTLITFFIFLMDEVITWRVLVSLVVIFIGIYIFKKNNKIYRKKNAG